MRQINFLIVFSLCLALVLFGMVNTEPGTVYLAHNIQVQAPLSIELILAVGVGAVIAWLFSLWTRLQRWLGSRQEIRQRDFRIQELERNVEQYKAEVQEQQLILPASVDREATVEAFAK